MSNHFMEFDLNRSIFRELIDECPAGEELPGCPLLKFRQLSTGDKSELLSQFTKKIIAGILELHHQCLSSRKEAGL